MESKLNNMKIIITALLVIGLLGVLVALLPQLIEAWKNKK